MYYININSGEQSVYNCTDNYSDMVDMTQDTMQFNICTSIERNYLINILNIK